MGGRLGLYQKPIGYMDGSKAGIDYSEVYVTVVLAVVYWGSKMWEITTNLLVRGSLFLLAPS